MLLDVIQPFIDTRAYDRDTSTYVPFPTQSDAMLASLQLFHNVPCRFMDLVISVITQPGFDASQVTLGSSVDVIRTVEDARIKDRMAIMHARSFNSEGVMVQAGLPQFVLQEVLDIVEADKVARIKARFEKQLEEEDMFRPKRRLRVAENDTLSNMSLVHRSWTLLAQKTLGRSLYIGKRLEKMEFLLKPPVKSIFGPWTALVAIDLYRPIKPVLDDNYDPYEYQYDDHVEEKYQRWFECLHRLVVGFEHLKCILLRSHAAFFTEWSNLTIRDLVSQNPMLEALTFYAAAGSFNLLPLVPLVEENNALVNLRSLRLEGQTLSEEDSPSDFYKGGFVENNLEILSHLSTRCAHLTDLTIKTNLVFAFWPITMDAICVLNTIRNLTFQFTDIIPRSTDSEWPEWTEKFLDFPKSKRLPALESLSFNFAAYRLVNTRQFHDKMKSICSEAGIRYT